MPQTYRPARFDLWRFIKKSAISGFVVFSFIVYVIDQQILALRNPQPDPTQPAGPQATTALSQGRLNPSYFAIPQLDQGGAQSPGQAQSAQPTQPPAPTQAPQGQYRDGTYAGPVTDAYYGPMQVQAVIQNGKLAQVDILQYPSDRRTSQRINSRALPWLESEAIQAQSSRIDFISGATLTSNAFVESLQSALQDARG